MTRLALLALAALLGVAHAVDEREWIATTCIVVEKVQDNARLWPDIRCDRTWALRSPALDVELVGGKYRVTVKNPRRVRVTTEVR